MWAVAVGGVMLPVNEVVVGDCLEVMGGWSVGSVGCVVTDPPYGIGYRSNHRGVRHDFIEGDGGIGLGWVGECYRVLCDGGCLLSFVRWDVMGEFVAEMRRVGFGVKNELVWVKNNWGMGDLRGAVANQHESILFAVKGRYWFPRGRPRSVYVYGRDSTDWHPTAKPVGLMELLVRDFVGDGVVVCDPFCGSGSTLVACQRAGVPFVGIEVVEKYALVARERLAAVPLPVERE